MSNEKNLNMAEIDLRRSAEKQLKAQGTDAGTSRTSDENERLLQELQIHQIELELQNAELRQARDEVETVLEKYTDLYDFAPVGYVTFDCFGAICAANLTAANLLGIERTRLLSRSFTFFVTDASRPLFSAFLDKVFVSQGKESCEVSLTTKSPSPLFVQIEAMASASGRECRAVLIDISARREMEEEVHILRIDLDAQVAALAAANIELEAFNFTVSHDLRNPLTVINGYCQLLQNQGGNQLDQQCRGYLEEIYEGSLRMNRLIDLLLKFSGVMHVELRQGEVNLSSLAAEGAKGLKAMDPERQVTFRIGEGIRVNGDSGLMVIVINNLLGNAWKYTVGQTRTMIEFGVAEVEGKPVYFVRDNGPGFEMAAADKLFVPFQRLPGSDIEGNGIGLATVDRIVKRHGGRVWAASEPGEGATFYFTLG